MLPRKVFAGADFGYFRQVGVPRGHFNVLTPDCIFMIIKLLSLNYKFLFYKDIFYIK